MSISQLIPYLEKQLDDLRARVASLESLHGVEGVSAQKSSSSEGSCSMCGITWQLGVTCFSQHMAGKRHKANLARANLARLSNNNPPSSSKKGTGHTQYRPTMCDKDILNGMPQIQGNVLGRLQSITCMKEYKRKSFEELHWEDLRTERQGIWLDLVKKAVDEEVVGATCRENEGVELKEKKGTDDEKSEVQEVSSADKVTAELTSALTEGVQDDGSAAEVTGDGNVDRKNMVEQTETSFVMLKPDQLVSEELHLADNEAGRKGLTKHSSEGCSVDVKDGTATSVVDEKWDKLAAPEEPEQRSQAGVEIISIRPRLKRHERKV